jgi:glucose-1-phosphate adenylyltransferase
MSSRMKKDSAEKLDKNLIYQADNLPKCMIRLGKDNRPFLDYILYNAALAGITEVLLILNPADTISQVYYENKIIQQQVFGLTISFARQHIPADRQKPLGTSDAILQALSQHENWKNDNFIVCNADNVYPAHIFRSLINSDNNAMIAFDAQDYEESRVRNCAIVQENEAGFLKDLIEKPTDEEWRLIKKTMPRIGFSWNIFKLNASEITPYLINTPLHPERNEKELPNSIRLFVKENNIELIWVNEVIPDLTSKEDLKGVQDFLEKHYSLS